MSGNLLKASRTVNLELMAKICNSKLPRATHGQRINTTLHVTLTGSFLTGRCNANKQTNKENNTFMAAYDINLKNWTEKII